MDRSRWTNRIAYYYADQDLARPAKGASLPSRAAGGRLGRAQQGQGATARRIASGPSRRRIPNLPAPGQCRQPGASIAGVLASLIATVACSVVAVMGLALSWGLAPVAGQGPVLLALGVAGMAAGLVAAYFAANAYSVE